MIFFEGNLQELQIFKVSLSMGLEQMLEKL